MTKLHELLAVEGDLQEKGLAALQECRELYTGGQVRLVGQIRTYEPLVEDGEKLPTEYSEMATTAMVELDRALMGYGAWLDVALQKEVSNCKTGADVVMDGDILLTGLPAPALLNLEKKLDQVKHVLELIPTLDPTEKWTWDAGQECYVSGVHQTVRTKKVPKVLVKYEATKEHPAQVDTYADDTPQGMWTVEKRSGMITVARRRVLLERIDRLAMAVKQARQRANDLVIVPDKYAAVLWRYLLG